MTKTNALESLVIASFVRGLSVRDVEATLAEALGDQAAISKSTVSSVCQAIKGECLTSDRDGLTAYLRFPAEHHPRVRHSNFIERTFGETRRRTKVIGRLPGETSCLTLVWAVLDRASAGWRGLAMTSDGLRLLQDLRRSLLEPPAQLRPHTVTTGPAAGSPETVSTVA